MHFIISISFTFPEKRKRESKFTTKNETATSEENTAWEGQEISKSKQELGEVSMGTIHFEYWI